MPYRSVAIFTFQLLLCGFCALSFGFVAGVLWNQQEFIRAVPLPLLWAWSALTMTIPCYFLTFPLRLLKSKKGWVLHLATTVFSALLIATCTDWPKWIIPPPSLLALEHPAPTIPQPYELESEPEPIRENQQSEEDEEEFPDEL